MEARKKQRLASIQGKDQMKIEIEENETASFVALLALVILIGAFIWTITTCSYLDELESRAKVREKIGDGEG